MLDTLAELPGDAARNIGPADWKEMSESLGADRTEEQVRELFYPGQGPRQVGRPAKRNPKLLVVLDDQAYWDIYNCIIRTPALHFPNVYRLTDLSKNDGRVLFQVMDHVVNWLNPNRTVIKDRRDNNKPPLRNDLLPALQHFSAKHVQQARRRLKMSIADVTARSQAETASIMLQQEVLEFVLDHLAAFKSRAVKAYLEPSAGGPNGESYADRFLNKTWRGVLEIVRSYARPDFRPEWSSSEMARDGEPDSEPSRQAVDLTGAFCQYAMGAPGFAENTALRHRIDSSAFRDALARWFSEQCGYELRACADGERGDGPRTPECVQQPATGGETVSSDSGNEQQIARAPEEATRRKEQPRTALRRSTFEELCGGATGPTILLDAAVNHQEENAKQREEGAEGTARRPLPASRPGKRLSGGATGMMMPRGEAICQQAVHRTEASPAQRTPSASVVSPSKVFTPANPTQPIAAAWRRGRKAAR